MKINRHSLVLLVSLSVLVGSWLVYSNWQQVIEATPQKITIAVSKTPLSAAFFVAQEKSLFNERCIQVELTELIGGKKSFETLMAGKADFATSSDSVMVFKSFLRDDFYNLATFVQSDHDIKIITNEDSKINDSLNLAGKKIAVIRGTASEYLLSTYLSLGGLSFEQVFIVHMTADKMAQALTSGEVDAIVPWEPYGYESVEALEGKGKILETKNLYTLTFNLIAAK